MNSILKIEHKIDDKKTEHVFYSNNDSKNLVVFFPGGGSNLDRPLLNNLRDYFLKNSYDVLNISYINVFKREEAYEVKVEKLLFWINEAIKTVSVGKQYDKMSFVTRSFGTLLSSQLRVKYSLEINKIVYISPIKETVEYFEDFPGYIVTASNDEYLTSENITFLSNQINENIIIFKDGTHNLETEDETETNNFYKQAYKNIINFIQT